MPMQENTKLMIGLREKCWTDTEIIGFCIWIESGNKQYRPKKQGLNTSASALRLAGRGPFL